MSRYRFQILALAALVLALAAASTAVGGHQSHAKASAVKGSIESDAALARVIPPMGTPLAPHLEFVGRVKAKLGVPVMHAARIADVSTARHAIEAASGRNHRPRLHSGTRPRSASVRKTSETISATEPGIACAHRLRIDSRRISHSRPGISSALSMLILAPSPHPI